MNINPHLEFLKTFLYSLESLKFKDQWRERENQDIGIYQDIGIRARDLKNSGKYGSGLSCRWALFTT